MMAARAWSLSGEHTWRKNRHDHHKGHARCATRLISQLGAPSFRQVPASFSDLGGLGHG
jgi:hypothetical protein